MRRTWGGAGRARRGGGHVRRRAARAPPGGGAGRARGLSGRGVPQPPAILLPPPFCGPARPLSTGAFLRVTELQNHSAVCVRRRLTPPEPHTRSECPGSHSSWCWTRQQQPLVSRSPILHTAPNEAPQGPLSPQQPSPLCLLPPRGSDLLLLIWLICSYPTNHITAR